MACLVRAYLTLFAFPQVIEAQRILSGSIRLSKKRPQQDSNLRTRLRSGFPCMPLTCANVDWVGSWGRMGGDCHGVPSWVRRTGSMLSSRPMRPHASWAQQDKLWVLVRSASLLSGLRSCLESR
jgi:hypothetical protein